MGHRQTFNDDFIVEDVRLEMRGLCRDQEKPYGGGGGATTVTGSGGVGGSRAPPVGFDNSMPIIKNAVDKLNVMAGELLQYQVGGTAELLSGRNR